jgi:hypothetical protein
MAVEQSCLAAFVVPAPLPEEPHPGEEALVVDAEDLSEVRDKCRREAEKERKFQRPRIEKIEFRQFHTVRSISVGLNEDGKLVLIHDDGSDMVSRFPKRPRIGQPLEYLVAQARGVRIIEYTDDAKIDDFVSDFASDPNNPKYLNLKTHEGEIPRSLVTYLSAYTLSCKPMVQRWERPWWVKSLYVITANRLELGLQYLTDGSGPEL